MDTCRACGTALPEDARFCPRCAVPVEMVALTEERKVATVLFADLVGSTELGEQDPERTRALLDRFYDAMAAEVARAGGTLEKFVGDAVMAAFGAPVAQEDHAERALHAAIAMRRRLGELYDDRLNLRIGVNTGEVVVGSAREGSSFVTGDAVNVCARLEQNAAPGEILVGERTAQMARGAFEFAEAVRIEAKGKRDGVVCRRLVRSLSLMRPRGVGGLNRVFVGRETELELLQTTYRRTVELEEPHLVTIVGDAGVGKSRLVRELWEWLGAEARDPYRRTGRCLPYGQGITYWPLGEILKEHLGVLETDLPEEVRTRLGTRDILSLTLGFEPPDDVHPAAARVRLHDAWLDFIGELARDRPLVLLVEDLHWAEPPLLDLLERTVRETQGPLLVLGTTRPELVWAGPRRNTTTIWLEPLSAEDTQTMVERLLDAPLPLQVRDVVASAEGNPFFVEELMATLIDQGLLTRRDGRWFVRELPEGFTVPDTVHGVLASRIDLLAPPEKAALQAASVIGRVFWEGAVRELIEFDAPDLALLEERDFIRRRVGSSMAEEREFGIKHALTREVAYAGIPKAKRARLHAAFAGWLERLGARDELAALLAHHYAEAVRAENADLAWTGEEAEFDRLRRCALDWLERAAEGAISRFELDDAVVLLERALALADDQPRQSQLWRLVGRAHALRFDGDAFLDAMEKSLAVCVDRATCADSYAELALQTANRSGMWRRRPDGELVIGWIDRALELAEPESEARAKALIARCFWDRRGGAALAREASALAERLGNPALRSHALMARSLVAFGEARYDEALTDAQGALGLVEHVSDPDTVADAQEIAIPACCAVGRLREARRIAVEHDAHVAPLSTHHRVHGIAVLLEVEELMGDWEEIVGMSQLIEERVEANLDTPCIRNARSLLVGAAAAAVTEAGAGAERLEARANEVVTEGYDFVLAGPRTRLALFRGDLDGVDAIIDAIDPEVGQSWFTLSAVAARLDGLTALGRRDAVEDEAPRWLNQGTYLDAFARRALGIVRGDAVLLGEALEGFKSMRLAWHAEETRRVTL